MHHCFVNTGGPSSEDPKKKRVFLFVMPLMNKGIHVYITIACV